MMNKYKKMNGASPPKPNQGFAVCNQKKYYNLIAILFLKLQLKIPSYTGYYRENRYLLSLYFKATI